MAYNNQQQNNRDPNANPNRLHLNFGFNTQQPNFGAEQGRNFPTTPSTFPQPLNQNQMWGTQQPQSGITDQGYFYNNPNGYPPNQYPQGVTTPGYARTPGAGPGYNDPTNGLSHQFAHQNLGGANSPRAASPAYRTNSPANAQRPRTGGGQQPQYGNYLGGPLPVQQQQQPQGPSIYDDELPPRNPEKYSNSIVGQAKMQTELTSSFFKDNVERARDRNARLVPLKSS